MIAWVCITFVMLALVCVVAVCVNFAKDGFEDAEGFHLVESSSSGDGRSAAVNRRRKINVPPAETASASLELAAETE